MTIVMKSVATYSYFVPTMMSRIARPANLDSSVLRQTIRVWTTLSPLRVIAELFAWITGIWALVLLSKG
jgi:hypothetical protein